MELTKSQEIILARLASGMPVSEHRPEIGLKEFLITMEDLKKKNLVTYDKRVKTPFLGEPINMKLTSFGEEEAKKYHVHR